MAYTMKDVAKRAGVSPATVSRVLNKTNYISPETAQRVLEVVSMLQYHKNVHARRLSTGQNNLVGLVISEITNPYFPELIRGFQAAAWNRGFDVLLCNTEYSQERTKSVIKKLIENDVCGAAVVTASVDRSVAAELIAADIAVVFSDPGRAGTLISNVSINYQRGISQAIEYMAGLGHRRTAIIAGPEHNRSAVMIRRVLEARLKERKMDPLLVTHCDSRLDAGVEAVRSILSLTPAPTVIFCGSDRIALAAMSAIEGAGAKVPDEVSVVGIDDISFASLTLPPLTTIRVPREQLGKIAFQAIDKMLHLKRRKGTDYHLQTELIVRRSTAPAW